jgi:hypothetical protein
MTPKLTTTKFTMAKFTLLLPALFLIAAATPAQYADSRPAPPSQSTTPDSAHFRYYSGVSSDWGLPAQLQSSAPSYSGASDDSDSFASGPTYAYATGDANWSPSVFVPPPRPKSQNPASTSPSASDIYRQLVQSKNRQNQPGLTLLPMPTVSIADIARQVRAQRTQEKPKLIIKQDADGNPVIVAPKK